MSRQDVVLLNAGSDWLSVDPFCTHVAFGHGCRRDRRGSGCRLLPEVFVKDEQGYASHSVRRERGEDKVMIGCLWPATQTEYLRGDIRTYYSAEDRRSNWDPESSPG